MTYTPADQGIAAARSERADAVYETHRADAARQLERIKRYLDEHADAPPGFDWGDVQFMQDVAGGLRELVHRMYREGEYSIGSAQ